MVQEIASSHSPNQGRDITNANLLSLYERAEGRKNVVLMTADYVDLGLSPGSSTSPAGLTFPVEAGVMYRFHSCALLQVLSGSYVDMVARGPGDLGGQEDNERFGFWRRIDTARGSSSAENWSHGSRNGSSAGAPTPAFSDFCTAELWGFIKSNLSGTLRINIYVEFAGTVFQPTFVEWW